MITNFKQNIIFLTITCFSMIGFLLAEDCYVYKGPDNGIFENDDQFQDGSEQYPYDNISDCQNQLSDSNQNTIYVGSGYYEIDALNLGRRNLVGSGVNVTKLIAKNSNADGIYMNNGAEISHVTFDYNGFFGNNHSFNDAIAITNFSDEPTKIHNCFFKNGINSQAIRINADNVDIRNNLFKETSIQFNNKNNITFMNNMFFEEDNFDSVCNNNNNCENVIIMHNLFLKRCDITSSNGAITEYNLVYYNPSYYNTGNGNQFGGNDSECGEMGQYQNGFDDFTGFDDLDFLNPEFDKYNIYALGEESILYDVGHPDPIYNDPDGSRADIGIMGGLYPWTHVGPLLIEFSVNPTVVPIDGQININARAVTE